MGRFMLNLGLYSRVVGCCCFFFCFVFLFVFFVVFFCCCCFVVVFLFCFVLFFCCCYFICVVVVVVFSPFSITMLILWFILIVNVRFKFLNFDLLLNFFYDILVTICWERAVPLAFHLCCFYFSAVLNLGVPFPFGVKGRMWNSISLHLYLLVITSLGEERAGLFASRAFV